MNIKQALTQKIVRFLLFILLLSLVLITLLPFYAMFAMGTYDSYKLFSFNGLPSDYLLENLKTVAKTSMKVFFKNSFVMATLSVILGGLSCTMCGYGFAKYDFKGKAILFKIVLFSMMLPSQLSLVAYVWEMRLLSLNNTLWPSIIPFIFMGFGVFWMTQNAKESVPNEIIESGRIDGASEFRIFFTLSIPLLTPAIMTLMLLIFIWSWNSFLIPLITINKQELFTLPLGIASFNGMYQTDNGAKILALSISTLPVIAIYLLSSKYVINGISAGAVKG